MRPFLLVLLGGYGPSCLVAGCCCGHCCAFSVLRDVFSAFWLYLAAFWLYLVVFWLTKSLFLEF